ncbi:hypothetical protein HR12_34100 [Microbacterium sp. SUBG005]|nr:hypothetical protein HR12_34100 [Microbacterium sp. SUBG005]
MQRMVGRRTGRSTVRPGASVVGLTASQAAEPSRTGEEKDAALSVVEAVEVFVTRSCTRSTAMSPRC